MLFVIRQTVCLWLLPLFCQHTGVLVEGRAMAVTWQESYRLLCDTGIKTNVQAETVQHCTAQYCTARHNTAQYSTAQYSTVL